MAAVKQLAGQTFWYGVSAVGAKFLNYLLVPLVTYLMRDPAGMAEYGNYNLIYGYFGLLNIIFTYGMETGFFRFNNKEDAFSKDDVFQTTFGSLLITTTLFCALIYFFRIDLMHLIDFKGSSVIMLPFIGILFFDTLSAIPFARLRLANRPKRYALIKLSNIITNIIFTVVFLVTPIYFKSSLPIGIQEFFDNYSQTFFLLLANAIASAISFLFLIGEWKDVQFKINAPLWKQIIKYSAPMILIGMAGMVNEVFDRQFLKYYYKGNEEETLRMIGIYSAVYKISIVITVFRTAFQMAAEPFFFKASQEKDAKTTYATVFKWFSITLTIAFLSTALFLDIWKYFVNRSYWDGLYVVPFLLLANICSGIYYNLSIWYKLTDRMYWGIIITLFGAVVTIIGNYYFIPTYGILACAVTTFVCYFLMMVISYVIGQKYYKVDYPIKSVGKYMFVMLGITAIQLFLRNILGEHFSDTQSFFISLMSGIILLSLYVIMIVKQENVPLKKLPILNKIFK